MLRLISEAKGLRVELRWIKGHAGSVFNHVADRFANLRHDDDPLWATTAVTSALNVPMVLMNGVVLSMDPRKIARTVSRFRMKRRLVRSLDSSLPEIDEDSTFAAIHGNLSVKACPGWTSKHINTLKSFRLKLLTGKAPTGSRKHRYWPARFPSPECRLCGAPFDDAAHAFSCPRNPAGLDLQPVIEAAAKSATVALVPNRSPEFPSPPEVVTKVCQALELLTTQGPLSWAAGAIATTETRYAVRDLFCNSGMPPGPHDRMPESKITALLAACLHALSEHLYSCVWLPRCRALAEIEIEPLNPAADPPAGGRPPAPERPQRQQINPALVGQCPHCLETRGSPKCCTVNIDRMNELLAEVDTIAKLTGVLLPLDPDALDR